MIVVDPALCVEQGPDGTLFLFMGISKNWIIIGAKQTPHSKLVIMGMNVLDLKGVFEPLPDELYELLSVLIDTAEVNDMILSSDAADYIWKKVNDYEMYGANYTSQYCQGYEISNAHETAFIRAFFQDYNIKNHIYTLEYAALRLRFLEAEYWKLRAFEVIAN